MWNSNKICCIWEKIHLFIWLSLYLSLFSLITQTSPTGPLTDTHFRTSIAKTDNQECKHVFKLPALSQYQYLHSQWDCEKAGNSQLGFSFPVVMLAIKRKRVSIWLPLKQSCSPHFIQEKDTIPRGHSGYMSLGWYLGCFIHHCILLIPKKSLFFWQANFPWTSSFLLKQNILRILKSDHKLGRPRLLRTILWPALVNGICLMLFNGSPDEETHY